MYKRGVLIVLVLSFAFFGFVSAGGTYEIEQTSNTLTTVSVVNAQNMYAYEVSLTYDGGEGDYTINKNNFLGAGATYGSKVKGGNLIVYGSRLDNTGQGVNGSGVLFSVTHVAGDSLGFSTSIVVDNDTGEVHKNYTDNTTVVVPPSGGSGGGGGGGGGGVTLLNVSKVKGFVSSSPREIAMNVILDKDEERSITLANNGLNILTMLVSSSGFGEEVKFDKSITLKPGEKKEFKIKVKAQKKGVIAGKLVFVYSENVVLEVPVIINTKSENFLFDAGIVVSDLYRNIKAGDTLKAQVNLLQVGPNEKVDVTATYQIKDFYGKLYHEESETFFVLGSKEFVKSFPTDELPPGKYIISMEIVYPGAFATSSAQFGVIEKGITSKSLYLIVIGLVFVLVASGFISWIVYQQKSLRSALGRTRR